MSDTLTRFARYLLRNYSEDSIREKLDKYPKDDKRKLTRALIDQREHFKTLTEEQRRALEVKDDIDSRKQLAGENLCAK